MKLLLILLLWSEATLGLLIFETSTNQMSWIEAVQYCEQRGATLAEITSPETKELVKIFLMAVNPTGNNYYWIALNDLFNEGRFRWGRDCSTPGYTDWSYGEPNDNNGMSDCVHLEHFGKDRKWNDIDCSARMYALCQR